MNVNLINFVKDVTVTKIKEVTKQRSRNSRVALE